MKNTIFFRLKLKTVVSLVIILLNLVSFPLHAKTPKAKSKWVGTWATAVYMVDRPNLPPDPGLTNNSFRQIVRVSMGGDSIRLRLSNEFSKDSLTIKSVQVAVSAGGNTINETTNKELSFAKKQEIIIVPGSFAISDPLAFKLAPRTDLAITIYYGKTSPSITGHPASRTTSYLLTGNDPKVKDFSAAIQTDHWYTISSMDVSTTVPSAACIAILGNSITDGRGSTTNMQNRWPDILSERLVKNKGTENIGVLNLGIGGNAVFGGGQGQSGVRRFDRDILEKTEVKWIIVSMGVNDIGGVRNANAAESTANRLIESYKQFIEKAHSRNIKIYGATILPFKGNSYYNEFSEQCRNTVNKWIRTSGSYDNFIDFEKVMRHPEDSTKIISSFQNDNLHPDAAGYKIMGEYVDLSLFIDNPKKK